EVGRQVLQRPQHLVAVAGLAHYRDARLFLEDPLQALPDHRMIVGQEDADHESSIDRGISSTSVVPPPRTGSIRNDPPAAAARSRMPSRPRERESVSSDAVMPRPSS